MLNPVVPARVIATCFGLVGFAAAIVIGLIASIQAETVIVRAIISMAACWMIGRAFGWLLERTVEDEIELYKSAHPIPDEQAALAAPTGDDDAVGDAAAVDDDGGDRGADAAAAPAGAAPSAGGIAIDQDSGAETVPGGRTAEAAVGAGV
ncbi:MAG: hypothetical protein CMJ18_20750 [Phycisphaeraceae bacterium]|jgi:hypothetical protein|nr:hypothetical protein [Phycisphaeraceae bacterium]